MLVTWEEKDVRTGRRASKPGLIIGDPNHNEVWIIGSIPWEHDNRRYVLVAESDGQVCLPSTKAGIASQLTGWGLLPLELCGEVRGAIVR